MRHNVLNQGPTMRHNVFNQGPRPFNSYSIDCLAIYYFSIQIINLISKIEHTAIEGVQGACEPSKMISGAS